MSHRKIAARGLALPKNLARARDLWNQDHPAERPGAFRFENVGAAGVPAELYIYDEISWWGVMAADFVGALNSVTNDAIVVHLNSPGGDVFDGLAIMNAIASHPAHVTMRIDSIAASIASVIAMAGDVIQMMPMSQMMIHNASGGVWGDSSDMRQMADLLDRQSTNIATGYQSRAGGDLADWQALMDAETWLFGQEAVDLGLADEVIAGTVVAPSNLKNQGYVYAGRDSAPTPVIPQSVRLAAKGGTRDDATSGAEQGPDARAASDRITADVAAGRVLAGGGGGGNAVDTATVLGTLAPIADQIAYVDGLTDAAGHPPVRCGCVDGVFDTVTELRAATHLNTCPISAQYQIVQARLAAFGRPANVGVLFDWTLGDGGVAGNCDICIDLADNGPYDESALPDFPAHPNDTCELQVAYGTNDRAAKSPTADQRSVIGAADAVAVLRELNHA